MVHIEIVCNSEVLSVNFVRRDFSGLPAASLEDERVEDSLRLRSSSFEEFAKSVSLTLFFRCSDVVVGDRFGALVASNSPGISEDVNRFPGVTVFLCCERACERNYVVGEDVRFERVLPVLEDFPELVRVVRWEDEFVVGKARFDALC